LFWIIYILASLFLNYLLVKNVKKRRIELYLLLSVILLTPATIDISSSSLAPAISVFFYDLILELNFSLRPLRPLALSLPITFLFIILAGVVKRKFF